MWTLAFVAATAAEPTYALLRLDGMDCAGCESEAREALERVPGVQGVLVSFPETAACLTSAAPLSADAVKRVFVGTEFKLASLTPVPACPASLLPTVSRDPWRDAGGLDVAIVSNGEALTLTDHLVRGKYTVIDFGAVWCGPCHIAARDWKVYMGGHADVAVRAVALPGADARLAFASPAAKQHLANVAGIPWMWVFGPDGKKVYVGPDAQKAIAAIEKTR